MFSLDWLASLGSVIVIDLVLSGDNAIVIGLAAAGLPPALRKRAIVIGILVATVLRIVLSLITFHLLTIIGLTLAGGLLLLWVCWKMWREIRTQENEARVILEGAGGAMAEASLPGPQPKSFSQALLAIVVADVSMALDNVLAVAGAAREHFEVLIFGLVLSIALMAVAANYIARLLERFHWLAYVGLAIVAYVALDMIWRGSSEVLRETAGLIL
ncbi:MAG TPA: YjbE family putative metal transport protein [Alphaproteobacteria bacterium]|jgi:YjbE family integral membrane protein